LQVLYEPIVIATRVVGWKIFALWLALTVLVVWQDNVQKCALAKRGFSFAFSIVMSFNVVMLLRFVRHWLRTTFCR